MRFVSLVDKLCGALTEIEPNEHLCADILGQKNFTVLRQSQQSAYNLGRAKARALERARRVDQTSASNFRPNRECNIIRSDRTRSEKRAFLVRPRILDVENNSAGDRALFRRVPKNQSVADKGEEWCFQLKLGHCVLARRERLNFGENYFRERPCCAVMNVRRRA